jgi:hypothetical protein
MNMHDIDAMRARLSAAANLPDTLAAGWDAFELVQAVADAHAEQAPDLFAAFMFAAASAADGRDAVGFAPSMLATPGTPAGPASPGQGEAYEAADQIVGLMAVLASRLQEAAGQAQDPADRQACDQAAYEAERILDLLGLDRQ